ncbi:hypothetical protein RED65_13117 [Oceanobacter sp. RED65]|uniref:Uncharacterized protein n=1 Tax=Bermanella marisrubri TaxID=207949 RepID=Q1MZ97_9GAMM|nr:hypothetical protein RED65_13117 [Oceanobacter sp. RED65] [Bermanella marisrubri]
MFSGGFEAGVIFGSTNDLAVPNTVDDIGSPEIFITNPMIINLVSG